MGGKLLTAIDQETVIEHRDARKKEKLFRCGEWTKIPVKSGTIRNELSALRRLLNLAVANPKLAGKVAAVSFAGILPTPVERDRTLDAGEKQALLADKQTPIWLKRMRQYCVSQLPRQFGGSRSTP